MGWGDKWTRLWCLGLFLSRKIPNSIKDQVFEGPAELFSTTVLPHTLTKDTYSAAVGCLFGITHQAGNKESFKTTSLGFLNICFSSFPI